MIDSGVELIEHPARVRAFEQRQGLSDKIAKIENPARSLFRGIAARNSGSDCDQGASPLKCCGCFVLGVKLFQPVLLAAELLVEIRVRGCERLGKKGDTRRAFLSEED